MNKIIRNKGVSPVFNNFGGYIKMNFKLLALIMILGSSSLQSNMSDISNLFKSVHDLNVVSVKEILGKTGQISAENKAAVLSDLNSIEAKIKSSETRREDVLYAVINPLAIVGTMLMWKRLLSPYKLSYKGDLTPNRLFGLNLEKYSIGFLGEKYEFNSGVSLVRDSDWIIKFVLVMKMLKFGAEALTSITNLVTQHKSDFEKINQIRELINSTKTV